MMLRSAYIASVYFLILILMAMTMTMTMIRSTSFGSVSIGKLSSRDSTTIQTLDDSTGINNDFDMSLVLLPTAYSPTAMPVAATTANDHTVYVHYCCQFDCYSMDYSPSKCQSKR
mmetsp:Transcript_41789/g.47194  ORF Transcript_41789/g.47194 Transcript_41789/m.47194 type:complete len:115 (-) Transcript_41789:133-477(-)